MIAIVGFGWAKPVMVNPRYYKHPRRDEIIVSAAGPVTNLFLAFVFAGLFKLFVSVGLYKYIGENTFTNLADMFSYTIWINIILFVFNLIPIYPLDGFHVLANILPYRFNEFLYKIRQYGSIILIALILFRVTSRIILPPTVFIFNNILLIFGL
jgi:Zn-dependent protease